MLELRKNKIAAKKDFEDILKILEDKDKQKVAVFEATFQKIHEVYRRIIQRSETTAPPTQNQRTYFSQKVEEVLIVALSNVESYKDDRDPKELARGLGMFLAAVQYGLVSRYFLNAEYTDAVVENVENILLQLHSLNKNIHLVNIAKRVQRISNETKKSVLQSNPYKELIVQIIAILTGHETE
jgi:hypothetical protein